MVQQIEFNPQCGTHGTPHCIKPQHGVPRGVHQCDTWTLSPLQKCDVMNIIEHLCILNNKKESKIKCCERQKQKKIEKKSGTFFKVEKG